MSSGAPRLSLAMIVKNEERCLGRCLDSVRGLVDETVVVDTGSVDGTRAVAVARGARVVDFGWIDDFSAARNHALDQIGGDWVLVLDADEVVSPELGEEIKGFVRGAPAVGRLRVVSDFRRGGQVLRSQSYVSRLFPRGARFEGRIHEQIVSSLPRVDLAGPLWHDGYLERDKSARNIALLERELAERPASAYHRFQLAVEHTSLGQTARAAELLREAWKRVGRDELLAPNVAVDLLYALMELKRFDEGLALIRSADEVAREVPDYHLVCGLFHMELVRSDAAKHLGYLPEIERRFRRCLEIGETRRFKSVAGTGSFLAWYNLGVFYHVFGEDDAARECLGRAAADGHEPAKKLLERLGAAPGRD